MKRPTVRMALREALRQAAFAKETSNWSKLRLCKEYIRANFKHRNNKLTAIGV